MSDKNFINSLPPKSAFKVGLVSGLMISFVIGFFILLSFVIDKDDNNNGASTELSNADPLVAIAKDIGINTKKLTKCIEEDRYANKVNFA